MIGRRRFLQWLGLTPVVTAGLAAAEPKHTVIPMDLLDQAALEAETAGGYAVPADIAAAIFERLYPGVEIGPGHPIHFSRGNVQS